MSRNLSRDGFVDRLIRVAADLGLLLLSALLFSLAFPNLLFHQGFWPLAFIALVPAVPVMDRADWKTAPFYGLFYGFTSYGIFNYWLTTFHPLAILIVPVIYAFYYLLLFPLLKLAGRVFPSHPYLARTVVWTGYEFLRTLGFLGYAYGIFGYTLYQVPVLIQISELFGVWGPTFLLAGTNFFLGSLLSHCMGISKDASSSLSSAARVWLGKKRLVWIVLLVLWTGSIIFGLAVQRRDYSDQRQWKVALIQHNADTWKGGLPTYRRNFEIMAALSDQALAKHDPDVVIWSETAFVPGVDWHTRFRTDPERYALVKELREYLEDKNVPFVLGNDDGQLKDPSKPPILPDGTYNRVDYNAVLHYEDGELQDTYRKTHLVPFTENFPYENIFPRFYQFLVDHDYHFWERGKEYTVFETSDGVRFSTPICFEDIFGYLSRKFVRQGAEVIVNLTNDSWARSIPSQMQHMAMAVFRSVELRRTVVRSSNSGMSCTINPDGVITGMLDPFIEEYYVGTVPVYTERDTLYYHWGDWFAWVMLFGGLLLLAWGVVRAGLGRKIDKNHFI